MIDDKIKSDVINAKWQRLAALDDLKAADAELHDEISIAKSKGATLQEIGNLLGVSRQRVHQMLSEDK